MASKIKEKDGKWDVEDNGVGKFKFCTMGTLKAAERAKARIDKDLASNKIVSGHRIGSPLGWSVEWPFTLPFELIIDTNGTKKAAEDRILELQGILDGGVIV